MQANAITLSTRRSRRTVAAVLVAAAAGSGLAIVAGNDSPVASRPAPDSVTGAVASPSTGGSAGSVSELSQYDGALLRHHRIKVAAERVTPIQPTVDQRRAAEQFHHFR